MADLNSDGEALLLEIVRQVTEGAKRGAAIVYVRLSDEWQAGERNLSEAGGTLMLACMMLDSVRAQVPKSLATVRIHWTPGWGFDDIPMQAPAALN